MGGLDGVRRIVKGLVFYPIAMRNRPAKSWGLAVLIVVLVGLVAVALLTVGWAWEPPWGDWNGLVVWLMVMGSILLVAVVAIVGNEMSQRSKPLDNSSLEEIAKLEKLRDTGVITGGELKAARRRITRT